MGNAEPDRPYFRNLSLAWIYEAEAPEQLGKEDREDTEDGPVTYPGVFLGSFPELERTESTFDLVQSKPQEDLGELQQAHQ